MSEPSEYDNTIVISDLLSFMACKVHILSKSNLIYCLRNFYSKKEIDEALKTFLSSIPPEKLKTFQSKSKDSDSLTVLYNFLKNLTNEDLPVFVCKNLNNIPKLDSKGKFTNVLDEDKDLISEQNFIKSQISEITSLVYQLKDQITVLTQTKGGETSKNSKERGLAYLQKLIDEEEKEEKDCMAKQEIFDEDCNESMDEEQSHHLKANRVQRSFVKNIKSVSLKRKKVHHISQVSPASSDSELVEEPLLKQKVIHIKNKDVESNDSPRESCSELNDSQEEGTSTKICLDMDNSSCHDEAAISTKEDANEEEKLPFIVVEEVFDENMGQFSIYKCSLCNFSTNDASAVQQHDCPQVRVIVCCFCNSSEKSIDSFNEHLKKHSQIRRIGKFDCLLCIFSCDERTEFLTHLKTHSWVKPFKCTLCNYRCNDEFRIKNHCLYHREYHGSNSFFCHFCTKVFGSRKNLDNHKFKHKRKGRFQCSYCSICFTKQSSLHQHILRYSKGKSHLCSTCLSICTTRKALFNHKRYSKH